MAYATVTRQGGVFCSSVGGPGKDPAGPALGLGVALVGEKQAEPVNTMHDASDRTSPRARNPKTFTARCRLPWLAEFTASRLAQLSKTIPLLESTINCGVVGCYRRDGSGEHLTGLRCCRVKALVRICEETVSCGPLIEHVCPTVAHSIMYQGHGAEASCSAASTA